MCVGGGGGGEGGEWSGGGGTRSLTRVTSPKSTLANNTL